MLKTILLLSPAPPYPPNQGCRRDIWSHIEYFHELGWRVILVECRPGQDRRSELLLQSLPIAIEWHFIRRSPHWSGEERPGNISKLQKLIDRYEPLVVWCEYAHFSSLITQINRREAQLWFRPHNFELAHAIDKIFAAKPWSDWQGVSAPKQALKWVRDTMLNLINILMKERLMFRCADKLFFISHGDKTAMSKFYAHSSDDTWLPTFIEAETIPLKLDKVPLDVIYIGIQTGRKNPNLAGALMLINQIIPAVEAAIAIGFSFFILWGKAVVKNLPNTSPPISSFMIIVDDLTALMRQMDIACFPIKFGWGCKVKVLEALVSGLPIIGAPQTFRGLPQQNDKICFACHSIADYVQGFKLLRNASERQRMHQAGQLAYQAWINQGKKVLQSCLDSVEKTDDIDSIIITRQS